MTTFVEAAAQQEERTDNGMKALKSTGDALVNLFFNIGASRGKDIVPAFIAAYVEDIDLSLRIALWARDARGGAGERKLFRDILEYLETTNPDAATKLLAKIPEIGRWDDVFSFKTTEMKEAAFTLIGDAIKSGDGLAAKWSPRKGDTAVAFRKFLGWSPKTYRKTLVNLTKVVETAMCANTWDDSNFSHVPSLASARYKKAFNRHTPKFAEYVAALVKGDPTVKVNAGAVFPYDVLKGVGNFNYDKTEKGHVVAQWDALPNYIGDANILPLVDVSGSMDCSAGSNGSITCMDVAVSLGLYISDKNTGKFKDTFITFSAQPELLTLRGNIVEKALQMVNSKWGMSTNLHAAFELILNLAIKFSLPASEMPEILLILSDMQFDSCARFDDSAMEMIERKYNDAGYTTPKIVFWNLQASGNVPVASHKSGAALVSGFSPSLVTSILKADMTQFTPVGIMMETITNPRYDV